MGLESFVCDLMMTQIKEHRWSQIISIMTNVLNNGANISKLTSAKFSRSPCMIHINNLLS